MTISLQTRLTTYPLFLVIGSLTVLAIHLLQHTPNMPGTFMVFHVLSSSIWFRRHNIRVRYGVVLGKFKPTTKLFVGFGPALATF